MKQLNITFKGKTLLFALLLLGSFSSMAYERSKTFVKAFKINPSTSVEINNKYGRVKVIPWEKDSVKIEVNLYISSNNSERLDKQFESVDIDFIETPGFITARTLIGSRSNSVWTDISALTRSVFSNSSDMTIDYTVHIPSANKLAIENKYGDIYVGEMLGNLNIDLSHGNLKATNIKGNCNLTIKYGEATVKYIKNGRLTLEYTDLQVEKAGKVDINSKSGNISFTEIAHLNYDARRGDYKIVKASAITGESMFTNVDIDEVKGKIYIASDYGDITVNKIASKFDKINLNLKFSDANLHFVEDAHFKFKAQHRNSTISLPQGKSKLKTQSLDDDKEKITTGIIGDTGDANNQMNVDMDRSTLNIYFK